MPRSIPVQHSTVLSLLPDHSEWCARLFADLFPRYRELNVFSRDGNILDCFEYVRVHEVKLYLPPIGLFYYADGRKTASPACIFGKSEKKA